MKRWVFNVAAGVSLAVCIATCVLWVRSYWISDALAYLHGSGEFGLQTASGLLAIGHTNVAHRTTRLRLDQFPADFSIWDVWGQKSAFNRVGFGYNFTSPATPLVLSDSDVVYPSVSECRLLVVPAWSIVLVFVVLPARWSFVSYRRSRRRGLNHCAVCGYDLRATPDRCPECGTVAGKAQV